MHGVFRSCVSGLASFILLGSFVLSFLFPFFLSFPRVLPTVSHWLLHAVGAEWGKFMRRSAVRCSKFSVALLPAAARPAPRAPVHTRKGRRAWPTCGKARGEALAQAQRGLEARRAGRACSSGAYPRRRTGRRPRASAAARTAAPRSSRNRTPARPGVGASCGATCWG